MQSAWRRIGPSCISVRDFEVFEEQTVVKVVDEIVCMDKSIGLEVDAADVKELVEEH